MRTLSALSLAVTAIALLVVYNHHPNPWILLFCLALLVSCGGLALMVNPDVIAPALLFAAAGAWGVAGYTFGMEAFWPDRGAALFLGGLGFLGASALLGWGWSLMRRVFYDELVLLSDRFRIRLEPIPGPAHVLPITSRLLAVLPRYQQEQEFELSTVNTRPRSGPLGRVAQNIDHLTVELVYRLDERGYFKPFKLHNRDAIFRGAAEALGKDVLTAMRDKQFWVEVWRRGMVDVLDRHLRAVVHRSGLTPIEVSERREELAAVLMEELHEEAERMGLILLECNINQVVPDEAAATLAGREALLQSQAQAESLKLTGTANAEVWAAQVRAVVDQVRTAGGEVPQRIVELVICGVLPMTVLGAYFPGGFGAAPATLFEQQARAGRLPAPDNR